MRNHIFISYSHNDRHYFDELKVHLVPLVRAGIVDLWDDTQIKPGQHWNEEIMTGLQDVRIAILLVSPNFAASDFVTKYELPKILSDEKEHGLTVLWIPVSTTAGVTMRELRLDQFQAAYTPPEPLDRMAKGKRRTTLAGVMDTIDKILNNSPQPPNSSSPSGKMDTSSSAINNSQGLPGTNTNGFQNARLLEHPDHVPQRPDGRVLFGRNDILATLDDLDPGWRVLLHGFPGEGKTAIASTFAMRWLERKKGAVIWLKAGNAPFELLLESVGHEVGISIPSDEGLTFRFEQAVNNALRAKHVTAFIVDDSWNSDGLRKLLDVIPSNACVLVTSRDRFSPVDRIIDVERLVSPADVNLLHHIAGNYLENDMVGAQICSALYGHAFSIRLAGYIIKQSKWSGTEFLAKYSETPISLKAPRGLREDGRSDVGALIQTSLNALQSSVEEIDRQAGELFLILGTYVASVYTAPLVAIRFLKDPDLTPEERKSLNRFEKNKLYRIAKNGKDELITKHWMDVTIEAESIEAGLDMLVQWGLLSVQRDASNISVYRLHDLAFAYSSGNANAAQRNVALNAIYNYVRRYGAPNPENFDMLTSILPHLVAAIQFAFDKNDDDLVLNMVHLLYNGSQGDGQILTRHMLFDLSEQLLLLAVESANRKRDKQAQTVWLGNLAEVYVNINKVEQAIAAAKQALEISRETKDQRNQSVQLGILAKAYHRLAINHQQPEGYNMAITHFKQAIEIAASIQEWRIVSNAYNNLGIMYEHMKRPIQAMECFQWALKFTKQRGDELSTGLYQGNVGRMLLLQGDIDRAEKLIRESLDVAQKYQDKHQEADLHWYLGDIFLVRRNKTEAENYWRHAMEMYRNSGLLENAQTMEDKIRQLK